VHALSLQEGIRILHSECKSNACQHLLHGASRRQRMQRIQSIEFSEQ
jgi:hypothetical protein